MLPELNQSIGYVDFIKRLTKIEVQIEMLENIAQHYIS